MISTSAALQITSENFLQSFLSCASDFMFSESSFLFKGGTGKSLSIDFNVLVSIFNVVTMLSLGLPLNPFLIFQSRIS